MARGRCSCSCRNIWLRSSCRQKRKRSVPAAARRSDGRVVAFPCVDFELAPRLLRNDRDRAVMSVRIKGGGPIRDQVAAPDYLLQLRETSVEVTRGPWEECRPAG